MEHSNFSNTFVLEELERYKLIIDIGINKAIKTSNDFNVLKEVFDTIVNDNMLSDDKIVISIYDYNKDTNIEYYDSDNER